MPDREKFAAGHNAKGEWVDPRKMLKPEAKPQYADPNYCEKSEDCKHEVGPKSFAKAVMAKAFPTGLIFHDCEDPWIYDVQCKKCGASGAIRVNPTEVQW